MLARALQLLLLFALAACQGKEEFFFEVPAHIPQPQIPADNSLTAAKIELGKTLFFDKILSQDNSVSCASCHIPQFAFADTARVSQGFAKGTGFRNSPALVNVVFHSSLFRDGGVQSLERAVHPPVLAEFEMNMHVDTLEPRLRNNAAYIKLFKDAFDTLPSYRGAVMALASYQRTLIDFNSPYDNFLAGDENALTESQKRGLELFKSKRLNCNACHKEHLLMDNTWHNIGLYEVYADHGRGRVTLDSADFGKFRTPMLRYVSLTAPYMHDGSLQSLSDVIDFYASGGKNHPNKSEHIKAFTLTEQEKLDLLGFLEGLGK